MGSEPKRAESDGERVTLRAIARRVGYSHVTVARALREKSGVGTRAREHIRDVAREMGYRVDPVMSRMMRQIRVPPEKRSTETIGVVRRDPADDAAAPFGEMFNGIEEQLDVMGYRADYLSVGAGGLSPRRLREVLEARGIRGVLLAAVDSRELEGALLADFLRVKLPLPSDSPDVVYVARNPYSAYKQIYDRLRALGYARVGFAKRDCIVGFERSVILGCLEAHAPKPAPGEAPVAEPLFVYDEHAAETADRMRAWVDANRLEAIVAGNAAYPFARRMGYRIPEELGFVATNLKPSTSYSGVSLPLRAMGRASVRIMDNLLKANLYGRPEDTEVVLLPPEWSEGATLLPRAEMTL